MTSGTSRSEERRWPEESKADTSSQGSASQTTRVILHDTHPEVALSQPTLVIQQSARSHLTDRVKIVLDPLLDFLQKDARSRYIPLHRIELQAYSDPEEDSRQLVVQFMVSLSDEDALRYWDRLGLLVELWTANLPENLKAIVRERIAFDVQWKVNGPAS